MERIKIKSCIKKETSKGVYYTIELEDGRKGLSSENLTEFIGKEKDLEVKEGKLYNNIMQHYFNLPKINKGKGFFQKDYTFEKRNSSLEKAIETAKIVEKKSTSKEIIDVAESYYQYLNKK